MRQINNDQTRFFRKTGGDKLLRLGDLLIQCQGRSRFRSDKDAHENPKEDIAGQIKAVEKEIVAFFAEHHSPLLKYLITSKTKNSINSSVCRVVSFLLSWHFLEEMYYAPLMTVVRACADMSDDARYASIMEYRRVIAHLTAYGLLEMNDIPLPELGVHLSPKIINAFLDGDKLLANLSKENVEKYRKRQITKRDSTNEPKVKPETSSAKKENITPKALYQTLSSYVVCQHEAVRLLSVRGYLHLKRAEMIRNGREHGHNQALLFYGPSGTGKTYLAELFGQAGSIPFVSFSCTQATATGYVGVELVDDSIKSLLAKVGDIKDSGTLQTARFSCILYDEWDKKRAYQSNRDVGTISIQHEVLRLMEGAEIVLGSHKVERHEHTVFNSNGTMFIFAGAMTELENVLKKMKKSNRGIGFGVNDQKMRRGDYLYDALIEYGFIPEFVSRLTGMAHFHKLSPEALYEICVAFPGGVIRNFNEMMYGQGLEIDVAPSGIRLMAEICSETGMMARGLKLIVDMLIEDSVFEGRKGKITFSKHHVEKVIEKLGTDEISA